jgi:hypothetical protein
MEEGEEKKLFRRNRSEMKKNVEYEKGEIRK